MLALRHLLILPILLAALPVTAEESNDRVARIVLFAAEEAKVPENYQARLGSLAVRTEKFFEDGMKQWERPAERSEIFARNEAGEIVVTLVRGKLLNANGRAALPELQRKAVTGASQQLKLNPQAKTIWWIFYLYPGVKGFQGGARGTGGLAVNAFPENTENVDPSWELASEPMVVDALKGTIHEFGHALGLPHIGPRPGLDLGNSLMGPINKSYWGKTGTDDERVYLNEACAALLDHHPVFQAKQTAEPDMPDKLEVAGLSASRLDDGSIQVQGTLKSSINADTVVAVDSSRHQFGDYWARSYTGRIDPETGVFQITISEPFESGTLHLGFCLENGINTDGQKVFQRGSELTIRYPELLAP